MPAAPDAPMAGLGDLTQRWAQEALRRGARWFGIACAALPVLELQTEHSVVDALLAGLAVGSWPTTPPRVWILLLWFVACGVAAGRIIGGLAPRSRLRMFAACLALHAGFAVATGLHAAGLVALACFGWSFLGLWAARAA